MQENHLPPRNNFLSFIQRHIRPITWVSLYLIIMIISSRHQNWLTACLNATCTLIPMLILWAVLRLVLLPHLLHKNKVMFFISCMILLFFLVIGASHFDIYVSDINTHRATPDEPFFERFFIHTKYTILLVSTMAVVSVSFLIDERKEQLQKFKEQQMQEQLKYLRAQINPHFLFNALNCIYALTITQDEQAPDSVLKLSEMLRYVIDDCRQDQVLLSKEVKYIQNYIDFQRIRMGHQPDLTFDVQITDPQYTIPPMILQPIIENCFKHSRVIDDPKAWIRISIRQNESGMLFTCDNSKPAATTFSRQSAIIGRQDEERTGIGLMNVQQRLDVLFGDKCSLKVIEDDSHYKTILHI